MSGGGGGRGEPRAPQGRHDCPPRLVTAAERGGGGWVGGWGRVERGGFVGRGGVGGGRGGWRGWVRWRVLTPAPVNKHVLTPPPLPHTPTHHAASRGGDCAAARGHRNQRQRDAGTPCISVVLGVWEGGGAWRSALARVVCALPSPTGTHTRAHPPPLLLRDQSRPPSAPSRSRGVARRPPRAPLVSQRTSAPLRDSRASSRLGALSKASGTPRLAC